MRTHLKAAVAVGLTALCFTSTAAAQETPAASYDVAERAPEARPNRFMLVTGLALFAVPWVSGVFVAAQSSLDTDHWLYVPAAGPWIDLAERPCAFSSSCSSSNNFASALLVGSGVAQGAGIILAAGSFLVTEPSGRDRAPAKPETHLVPVSFNGGGGLGAVGTF